MNGEQSDQQLRALARRRGIQLSYTGHGGGRVRASRETLSALLEALGHPVADASAVSRELRLAAEEERARVLDPVVVLGRDGTLSQPIRLPRGAAASRCRLVVHLEAGGEVAAGSPARLRLPATGIPAGYHRLALEGPGVDAEALLLVPPRRRRHRRGVGVMAPVYALRGRDDWGIGSYTDLADLVELAGAWGARLVGSLPLLSMSTRSPIDPSPYLPTSRMFWNELYVDVAAAAALAGCAPVDAMRPDVDVRDTPGVDYDVVALAKRRALQACAAEMETAHGQRREDFEAFLSTHPELKAYAEFCGDGDAEEARYHRFVQYAAATQLGEVAARARRADVDLYLDLPVGVHPHGYDTWAHPELFAAAQVGAPPDSFFAGGQAWGFPPLHPERLRRDRYAYFISALRHVLQYARAIRVDHILGLQRLYWIPSGADPSEGGYVRYHDEELRAILAIEAQRADATVVGEDLGTVSPKIRAAMDRDGILHTFVYQFDASAADPLPQPRRPSVASVGSHDLPRFAAFWRDPEQRELAAALGTRDPRRALRQCLEALAAGPAAYVVVDVADLEGEVEPDNRPGTGVEAGNWRRRLPRPVQELAGDKSLRDLMSRLAAVKGAR